MSEPDGNPRWTYVSDTNQIWDEWTEDVIAENYGGEAQGRLLAAAPALLIACQKMIALHDSPWSGGAPLIDHAATIKVMRAAIAAALPPVEPCQGPDMSYLEKGGE